jgi:hypothetical protein
MSLYGSITELQHTTVKFYLTLEQRFKENKLIRELWGQMAQDLSQQITSLHDLPKSFWTRFTNDEDGFPESFKSGIKHDHVESKEDRSLMNCIQSAIDAEEEIVLKVYVPIIRSLRKNWTNQALDFYILVNAHLVRIKRASEAFSGNPEIIHRSAQLFQLFEKEIQESPSAEVISKANKVSAKKPGPVKIAESPKLTKASKQGQSIVKHKEMRLARTTPLVEKADLRRRRASR